MEKAPTKSKLKLINIAINSAVEAQWREGISSKFSLRYINPESNEGGLPHHVWPSVRNSVHDSHKAPLKYNLLSGTYMLQSTWAIFNKFTVDSTCKLCDTDVEMRQQFQAECQSLQHRGQRKIQQGLGLDSYNATAMYAVTQLKYGPSVSTNNKSEINNNKHTWTV